MIFRFENKKKKPKQWYINILLICINQTTITIFLEVKGHFTCIIAEMQKQKIKKNSYFILNTTRNSLNSNGFTYGKKN